MLRQFSKTVSIYGLAPTFSKFIGFFLIPVYTRVFCPEEYGAIDLFNTIIHLFTVLINLQIYSAVGRHFNQTKDKKLLVSTGLWNEIFLSVIIVSPLILFSTDINRLLLNNIAYSKIFVLALVWMPFNILATYLAVVMRFENKPIAFLQIAIVQTVTKVVISLLTILVLDFGIAGIYIGHLAGDLVALCLFLFFLRGYIGLQFNFPLLKRLLLFSLPLVPATFAFYGSDFLSRAILLKYLSLTSIGIFAVAIKVASAFEILMMALRMAWEPFIYANLEHADHQKQFVRIYKMVAMLLCLLVCTVTIFANEILFIITTGEYYAAASIIGILSINFVLKILLELVGIGPKIVSKTMYDSFSRISGVAVSILSMLVLIPHFGIMGAALALSLGSGISLSIGWYYTEKFYPVGYPKLFTSFTVAAMFLVVVLSNSYAVPFIVKCVVGVAIFLVIIYYRHVVERIINSPKTF